MPILQKVIDATREEFADAIANGDGIYAVGYCFGGKYALLLAGEHPDTVMWGQAIQDEEKGMVKKGPYIKAGAIAHGTLVTVEDLSAIKVPMSMICIGGCFSSTSWTALIGPSEDDQLFPDDVREEGRKNLEGNKIEHEIHVYSGVPHGNPPHSHPTQT